MKAKRFFGQITDYKVHETCDYSRFKLINGNRVVKTAHKNVISSSIEKYGAKFVPIMVNEKSEIIDGQTRFAALKSAGLPIPFIVCKGYTIRDVTILNAGQLNWSYLDYAESFAKMGKGDYEKYLYFRRKYKSNHQILSGLLTGCKRPKKQVFNEQFKDGRFKARGLARAIEYSDMIMSFKPYFERFRQRNFIYALFTIFAHPKYDHKRMLHKLSYQSARLTRQPSSTDYIYILEKIYNYNSHNGRIRFVEE